MKDRKYDKHHVWSKNHSGCLETSCHVRGPLRNKMATLVDIPSRPDSDPLADPVPDQTMLPTVSLTESDIPRAFLKPSILKGSGYVRLFQAYCWQHSLIRNWIGRRITVRAGRNVSIVFYYTKVRERDTMSLDNHCGFYSRRDVYRTSDLSCKGSIDCVWR